MDPKIRELLGKLSRKESWRDPIIATPTAKPDLTIEECFPTQPCSTVCGEHLLILEESCCTILPHTIDLPAFRLAEPSHTHSRDWVFLDIESTGGSSEPLFLVGLLFPNDNGARVELHFARHYEEEASVLSGVLQSISGRRVVVTFNGKSYDIPVIRDRSRLHRLDGIPELAHLDLLHISRRVFPKGTTTNHRLKTLEAEVLGRERHGDIDSSEIPQIYHHYILHNDARTLVQVIKHNLLDLWAMYDLVLHILDQENSWLP